MSGALSLHMVSVEPRTYGKCLYFGGGVCNSIQPCKCSHFDRGKCESENGRMVNRVQPITSAKINILGGAS